MVLTKLCLRPLKWTCQSLSVHAIKAALSKMNAALIFTFKLRKNYISALTLLVPPLVPISVLERSPVPVIVPAPFR